MSLQLRLALRSGKRRYFYFLIEIYNCLNVYCFVLNKGGDTVRRCEYYKYCKYKEFDVDAKDFYVQIVFHFLREHYTHDNLIDIIQMLIDKGVYVNA